MNINISEQIITKYTRFKAKIYRQQKALAQQTNSIARLFNQKLSPFPFHCPIFLQLQHPHQPYYKQHIILKLPIQLYPQPIQTLCICLVQFLIQLLILSFILNIAFLFRLGILFKSAMRVAPVTDVSIILNGEQQPNLLQPKSKWKSYALRAGILLSFLANLIVTYWVMFKKNQPFAKVYFIYITPAPIFFKIWPLIYTTIFASIAHTLWYNVWRTKASVIYIISNILLIISSAIWEVRNVASIAVSGFVLASVDNATIYFWRVLMDEHQAPEGSQGVQLQNATQVSIQNPNNSNPPQPKPSLPRYTQLQIFMVRNVFALYIGWISVTGTVIVGLTTVYWWGFTLCQQLVIFWITTPLFAIAIYLFMATKSAGEYKYCLGYVLAVGWGFIGAGIASVENIKRQGYC